MNEELSRRGGQNHTNDATTGNISEAGTDWDALRALSDADIHAGIDDDPDAIPTDAAFWNDAKLVYPEKKTTITIRLDTDLVNWLRQTKGYQTRINAVLKAYKLSKT